MICMSLILKSMNYMSSIQTSMIYTSSIDISTMIYVSSIHIWMIYIYIIWITLLPTLLCSSLLFPSRRITFQIFSSWGLTNSGVVMYQLTLQTVLNIHWVRGDVLLGRPACLAEITCGWTRLMRIVSVMFYFCVA